MSGFLLVLQRMNSVKYNFIKLKKEMESYERIRGEEFEKSYIPLHGNRPGDQKLPKSSRQPNN